LLEGRLSEGRRWLGRVMERDGLSSRLRVSTRLAAGILAYFQDDADVAREHLEGALGSARDEGDDEAVAMALGYLGALALGAGDTAQALSMVEEASEIAGRLGFYEGQLLSLSLSSVIAAMEGDLEREKGFYTQRLEIARSRGDRRRIAETLGNLADIALAQGSVEQAAAFAEEALKLARGVARMVTRDALLTFGRIELASGRPESATEVLEDALRLSLDLGQVFEAAQALTALAGVASAAGDHDRAARLFGAGERWQGETSPLDVDLEPDLAEHRQRTRDALGDDRFRTGQLHGAALTLEDVAAMALGSRQA
jgi:tetratricopeptide (TPR) repeat protein